MSTFKINFLKLLKSTAMTLLFIPGVSAMVNDNEGWESYQHLLTPLAPTVADGSAEWENWDFLREPSSSSGGGVSTPSALGFVQTDDEKMATELRRSYHLGEPNKLFLFQGRRFIKGEVPGDGTCFLHTLNMLFPTRGISRDEFAIRLSTAFLGRNTSVSSEELRQEFAAELYTQLYQSKVMGGTSIEFKGEEIDKLSEHLLKNTPDDYLGFPENVSRTMRDIATNDKIIKEMLVCFAQTYTMLSLPAADLENIGSFGLACKLFELNLDIYAPTDDESNSLYKRKEYRFARELSLPRAAFYARAHVSPLCFEEDPITRKRFAENEIRVMLQGSEISSSIVDDFASQTDPLSFSSLYSNGITGAASTVSSSLAPSSSSSTLSSPSSSSTLAPVDESVLPARTTKFQMGEPNSYQTTGFSAYEGTHRWTEGMEASLTLPFEKMGRRPSRISFLNTRGLVTASRPQELTVKVNGKEVGHYVYTAGNNNQTIDVRLPEAGPATIKFEIPTAASPSDLRINADKRVLGISFRDVQFHY
ncbi:MAG: hypothetical protein K2X02_04385 [Alphaproteobacteria bacterium]|nr:hypothetical protein [Alphaproteobacteria bacterium]